MSVRTLLVDDAPILRQLVRMVLEADGSFAVVSEAGDGVEAIAAAREHQPDLILLDMAMPRMGGVEALPHLRAAAPSARVVVFTGFEGRSVVASALAAGATRVLHKGLDPHALCRELLAIVPAEPSVPASTPAPAPRSSRQLRRDTRSARRARRGRMRIPGPVAAVLVVALLLALYGAAAWIALEPPEATTYAGGFQEAAFQEQSLAGRGEPAGDDAVALGRQPTGTDSYTVVVPSQSLRWTVHADGAVRMASGSLSWPEARAAFAQWYEARGLGVPSFESLRLVTTAGEVLDRDALV